MEDYCARWSLAANDLAARLTAPDSARLVGVWTRWQRWTTGGLLGAVGVKLAIEAPAPA
ncbi:hypothetical protein [Clavibacter michiganensis]|uniref:hypothetical protein n=1 Tax=Clavibacter michiganensis TaxID=28447 RepID=UPI000A44F0BF|nr:hypothetical protein [Clavibacter michiganensis]